MSSPTPVKCANPACKVAEDGKCLEGHDLKICPQFGKDLVPLTEAASAELESKSASLIFLPLAEQMTAVEASAYLKRGEARTIAIIGNEDAGKTSLIACIYDLFQTAATGTIWFGGSDTLHAFEQVCHDARQVSRRKVPHTQRTKRGESRFYHLDVAVDGAHERLALLLADRAGEEYLEAASETVLAKGFYEVKRADTVLVLVDGEKMLDDGERHNAQSDVQDIIQAILEAGTFQAGQRMALILTKFDAISGEPNGDRAQADFERLVGNIRRMVEGVFSDVAEYRVAASPKEKNAMRGDGVEGLLRFCLQPAEHKLTEFRSQVEFSRSFSRLRPH